MPLLFSLRAVNDINSRKQASIGLVHYEIEKIRTEKSVRIVCECTCVKP